MIGLVLKKEMVLGGHAPPSPHPEMGVGGGGSRNRCESEGEKESHYKLADGFHRLT
jgi:hypothetical protein